MLKKLEVTEAASFSPLADTELKGLRYKVRLIEGDRLGSTGYYPADTLLRDGPKIFKKGTPMYLDHQMPDEKQHRPFGSIDTFAGELAEDAYYDGDGLYAEIEVFEHQAPKIKALKDRIGISIRATGMAVNETINGKLVPVFKELTEARSADFVVRPGAGGKIVSILESAEENSEEASELEEGSRENMDEVLEAIKGLESKFDARLTAVEESVKAIPAAEIEPVESEESEKTEPDYDAALEIAEAFAASELDAEGRARVIDLHRATKKPIAELISAEESYVKSHVTETLGGSEKIDAEESAVVLPKIWKDNK